MRFFKTLVLFQATYTFLTAVWPIVHIESFMEVSGYKKDVWLVKTVGAILIPIASCLMMYLFIKTDRRPAFVLGSLSCIAFITIDFYYALNDVISAVYLADGVLQILFLAGWVWVCTRHYQQLIK